MSILTWENVKFYVMIQEQKIGSGVKVGLDRDRKEMDGSSPIYF